MSSLSFKSKLAQTVGQISRDHSNINIHSDKQSPQKSSVSKLEQTTHLKSVAGRPVGKRAKFKRLEKSLLFGFQERGEKELPVDHAMLVQEHEGRRDLGSIES